jgi:hypothetical protein
MRLTKPQMALALVVLVAGLLLVGGSWGLRDRVLTRFSPKFSNDAFARLRVGDELSAVTNGLGAPLDFTVIPQDANAIPNNPLSRTNAAELVQFASNGRDLVLMRYSQPKWLDHYKAFEVFVRGGKVVEKRSYWYWD